MIDVSMRQYNCGRGNAMQSAEPIRPTINHDPSVPVLNEQRTMPVVPTRAHLDLAARSEKRKFKNLVLCCHFGRQSEF